VFFHLSSAAVVVDYDEAVSVDLIDVVVVVTVVDVVDVVCDVICKK